MGIGSVALATVRAQEGMIVGGGRTRGMAVVAGHGGTPPHSLSRLNRGFFERPNLIACGLMLTAYGTKFSLHLLGGARRVTFVNCLTLGK